MIQGALLYSVCSSSCVQHQEKLLKQMIMSETEEIFNVKGKQLEN